MHNWNWNPHTRSVGIFSLDSPVAGVLSLVSQLERFDYEEFDTYLIEDIKGSKLFVIGGLIASIQCGLHFFVNGVDVIGMSASEAQRVLGIDFLARKINSEIVDYINETETMKLVAGKEDTILWVTVISPERWPEA